jgi:hypothetical protein
LGRGNPGGCKNNGRAFLKNLFSKTPFFFNGRPNSRDLCKYDPGRCRHAARRAIFFVTFSFLLTSPFQIVRNRMSREILIPFFP